MLVKLLNSQLFGKLFEEKQEHDIVCEDDNLPRLCFLYQSACHTLAPFVIERGYGIVEHDAGRRIAAVGNAENESYGIEYGYAYPESPVICAEPEADIPSESFALYAHYVSRRADAECGPRRLYADL